MTQVLILIPLPYTYQSYSLFKDIQCRIFLKNNVQAYTSVIPLNHHFQQFLPSAWIFQRLVLMTFIGVCVSTVCRKGQSFIKCILARINECYKNKKIIKNITLSTCLWGKYTSTLTLQKHYLQWYKQLFRCTLKVFHCSTTPGLFTSFFAVVV